jgi:hypothetical protein
MQDHISPPLAVFLVIGASLVFFLPSAISMNTQGPFVISGQSGLKNDPIDSTASALQRNPGASQSRLDSKDVTLRIDPTPASTLENKKGSLPLRTAAIVGSSAAAAATVCIRGGSVHSIAMPKRSATASLK